MAPRSHAASIRGVGFPSGTLQGRFVRLKEELEISPTILGWGPFLRRPKPSPAAAAAALRLVSPTLHRASSLRRSRSLARRNFTRPFMVWPPICLLACLLALHSRAYGGGGSDGTVDHGRDDLPWSATDRIAASRRKDITH